MPPHAEIPFLDQLPDAVLRRPPIAVPAAGELYYSDTIDDSPARAALERDWVSAFNRARVSAIIFGGAAGIASVAALTGSGIAHAEGAQNSQPDSPAEVNIGDTTLYAHMRAQGYSYDEIVEELSNHGFSVEQGNNLTLPLYSEWPISPEVQAKRMARVGDAGITLKLLSKGDTFYDEGSKVGVGSRVVELLTAEGRNPRRQPIGATLFVPASYFDTPAPVTAPTVPEVVEAPPVVITLTENDSIIKELNQRGVVNVLAVAKQVMATNAITSKESRHMMPGDTFTVPVNVFPPPNIAVEAAPATAAAEVVPTPPAIVAESPLPPVPTVEVPITLPAPVTDSAPLPTITENAQSSPDVIAIPSTENTVPPQAEVPVTTTPDTTLPTTDAAPTETVSTESASTTAQTEALPIAVTIKDKLNEMRQTYADGKADAGDLGALITSTGAHPDPSAFTKDQLSEEDAAKLFVLPDRQSSVNFVVNPATCSDEAWTTAPMQAFILTVADYVDWLTVNDARFTKYAGVQIEIGDIIAGSHRTHQFTTMVDLRSRFAGDTSQLHPNGPLFMSGAQGFDKEFTEAVYIFAHSLTYNGRQMLTQLITASKAMEKDLTGSHKKGDWVSQANDHPDHTHFELADEFAIGTLTPNPHAESCDDPDTGGHTPFEQPADQSESLPVPSTFPAPVDTTPATEPAPIETAPTTPEVVSAVMGEWKFVDGWQDMINNDDKLTTDQKAFMIQIGEAIMAEIQKGAPINGPAVWAQVMVESGWGTGPAAISGYNILSVKGNRDDAAAHPENYVWAHDDESYPDGSPKLSAFVKYSSYEDAIHQYIKMITSREYYADAVACRSDAKQYLEGLINELRADCSIGRLQGENGVTSYATDKHYVKTLMSFMTNRHMDTMMISSGGAVNLTPSAIQQWLDAA